MQPFLVEGRVDRVVAELATRQHGVVTRDQLRGLGLTDAEIAHRLACGRLLAIYRCVFAVGHLSLRAEGRWLAATLAMGPGAALSKASAAHAFAMRRSASSRIDVSVPVGGGRVRQGAIRPHRVPGLLPRDVTELHGIPITTPMRTLFDLSADLPPHSLRKTAMTSVDLQLFDLAALDDLLERHPRRAGRRTLRGVLLYLRDVEPLTRSELERRFRRIVTRAGLGSPLFNHVVAGLEVDVAWPEHRLAVELDSRRWHEARLAMATDRARDRRLTIAGWRPIRFTYVDVIYDAPSVVADLRALIRDPRRDMAA